MSETILDVTLHDENQVVQESIHLQTFNASDNTFSKITKNIKKNKPEILPTSDINNYTSDDSWDTSFE